jgi:hypothetical protein
MVQTIAQALAFKQLRYNVRRMLVCVDVVNDEDVRMIERAGGLRFLFEAM